MSNAKKIIDGIEAKKARLPRPKKVKVDLTSLPDAVVGGKLVAKVKDKIIFVRTFHGKEAIHVGHVFSIDEVKGDVTVWDETREQFYGFNLKEPLPIVKLASPGDGPAQE